MDFRQLESFLMIAKLKSFSKAAKELYITQPTISNHIKALEEEVGISLFTRSSWETQLTKEGELFLPYAEEILTKKNIMISEVTDAVKKMMGVLSIHTSTIPEIYLLPAMLAEFSKHYPDIQYHIKHADSADIIEGVKNDQMDFGFCGARQADSSLVFLPLIKDEVIFVVPQDFSKKKITLEALTQIPLLMREEGSGHRSLLEAELKKHGLKINQLKTVVLADTAETIKKMVEYGLGASFLSRFAVEQELKDGTLKECKIEGMQLMREFFFVYKKEARWNHLERKFIEFVQEKTTKQ